jgi:hypothetical protein
MLIQVRLVIGLRIRTEMSGPWGMTVETSCPDSLTIEWVGNRLASDRIRVARPPPFFTGLLRRNAKLALLLRR